MNLFFHLNWRMGFLITAEKKNITGKYKAQSGRPLTRGERQYPVTPQKVTFKGEKQGRICGGNAGLFIRSGKDIGDHT